ncbi:hypothetical protein C805_00427 [Eubacterium sp. 14-2]|nr:hypothetical protein C805_00427 [Eubacterium sp. 14-2]
MSGNGSVEEREPFSEDNYFEKKSGKAGFFLFYRKYSVTLKGESVFPVE